MGQGEIPLPLVWDAGKRGDGMEAQFNHWVLVVDDDENVVKVIGMILKKLGVAFEYAFNGEDALEKIRQAPRPFSMVIADQRLSGIIDVIIDGVNRGAINSYLSKPWNNLELLKMIRRELEKYEKIMENNRLFNLAKEQNTKLYALSRDLRKRRMAYRKISRELSRDIFEVEQEIINTRKDAEGWEERAWEDIRRELRSHGLLDKKRLIAFYGDLVRELYEQFQDIAVRNGFVLSE